jgi:hypothetical protein
MDARPRRSSLPAAAVSLLILLLSTFSGNTAGSVLASPASISPRSRACSYTPIPAGKAGGEAYAYGDASGAGGMTELQKHAAFFDANKDGVVSFSETYDGEAPVSPILHCPAMSFSLFLFNRIVQLMLLSIQVCSLILVSRTNILLAWQRFGPSDLGLRPPP